MINLNDPKVGLSNQEVLEHFKDVKESILEIHSLHGAFSSFVDENKQTNWDARCKKGIIGAKYRQYR